MINHNRRNFLLASAGVFALGVAGCSTSQTQNVNNVNSQVPGWVAALQAVATEVSSIMPQLTAAGLTGSAASKAQGIIAQIEKALGAIGSASTAADGQSVLATVETYINSLAPLVEPFVAAIPGGSIVGLIVAALPAIELAVNMLVTLLTPQAQALANTAPPLTTTTASAPFGLGALATSQQYLVMLEQRAAAKARYRRHQ